jgi:hypothetical protein
MDALTLTQISLEKCPWPCQLIIVIGGVLRDLAIVVTAVYTIRFLKAKTQ